MRLFLPSFAALVLALGCLSACHQASVSPEEVTGVYVGNYGTVVETINVRKDGTFDQDLALVERRLHCSGTWKIKQNGLEFFNMYIVFAPNGKLFAQPVLSSNHVATWVNHEGRQRIAFDIDCGYVVDRKDR